MATETITDALHDVALFHDIPDDALSALGRQVVTRKFTRGQLIFSQGDPGDGLYIVRDGQVSITRQNPNGDELIFGVCGPGEYFGDLALFDHEPRSADATAVEDCSLLFLSRTAFREFLHEHPAALLTCLQVVVRELRRCTDLADEIALLDVRSRLARRLVHLARADEESNGQRGDRSFQITQQQLANMTGATRESVNKHLNAFVDEGILRLGRGRIYVLDLVRLEECSLGFL